LIIRAESSIGAVPVPSTSLPPRITFTSDMFEHCFNLVSGLNVRFARV
jgi:hypothetical protein